MGGLTDAGAVAAAALAVTFGVASVAKLVRWSAWRRSLASYGLPAWVDGPARIGVPATELAIGVLVLFGYASTAGLAALVALGTFSAAVVWARVHVGPRLGCGCFAGDRVRDYRYLLLRNALLMAIASVAWFEGVDAPPAISLARPIGSDLVAALLVVFGLALATWVAVRTILVVRRSSAR